MARIPAFQAGRVGSIPITRSIQGLQKRYSPRKPRFYRGFRRLMGRNFIVRFRRCKTDNFPLCWDLNFRKLNICLSDR